MVTDWIRISYNLQISLEHLVFCRRLHNIQIDRHVLHFESVRLSSLYTLHTLQTVSSASLSHPIHVSNSSDFVFLFFPSWCRCHHLLLWLMLLKINYHINLITISSVAMHNNNNDDVDDNDWKQCRQHGWMFVGINNDSLLDWILVLSFEHTYVLCDFSMCT